MRPAIVSGMVTWNARSAIGQFFSLYLVTVPEVFAKVNSAQLPFRFWRDEIILQIMNLCLQYLSH